MSPFQTFLNRGIKGTGGLGRLGYGILQALSENLQIKKKHCFGFDLAGWGQGGGVELAESGGGGRWCCWSGRLLFGLSE